MRLAWLAAVALLLATACENESLRPIAAPAERAIANRDWLGAIEYYQLALRNNPDDADLRRGYLTVAEAAVTHFVGEARRYAKLGDFTAAELQIQQGLVAVPDSTLLKDERDRMRELASARTAYREASAAARQGRTSEAMNRVERALSLDPEYGDALKLLERLTADSARQQTVQPIRLRTAAPVTVNFRNAAFKEAMLALGQAYGVNMIFDASVEDRPITLYAEDVSFVQAFELLLKSNRSFYRRLGRNSVVIAPDTPDARAEYEDYHVRTYYLDTLDAIAAADLVSRALGIANVTVNESANTITVRESRERLALVAQLIDSNDREPAEVVMEVEILEVNRTKSEQLGLDFGSQITVAPPQFRLNSDIGGALGASAVSLPAATFRYFKQDVDAKTLASPSIRTLNKEEALIHIGDRVPLRSSTIQDATGQTRTTFEYRDVGIKLNVIPEIKLDMTVLVNLELEISSLGQNLGTAEEPAFAIGTRNVSTQMSLADGETAIIGGLIRDEDRDSRRRVPGLGAIPAVGRVFQSRDGQGTRTDILLTLTPRIIRGVDVPAVTDAEFFSGSGNRVTTEKLMDFVGSGGSDQPTIRLDLAGASATPASAGLGLPDNGSSFVAPPQPATPQGAILPATPGEAAVIGFARSSYEVGVDAAVSTAVTAAGFGDQAAGTVTVRYRPDLVEAESVVSPVGLTYEIDNGRGEVRLEITDAVAGASVHEIAAINFRGLKAGLSYLIFSNNFGSGPNVHMPEGLELRASRIAVR